MMCKSKHFFRDTEYYIYVTKNSVLIGKSPQHIKYTIILQLSTVIGWIYGHRNQFIGFKLRWKNKWKLMIMETKQCYQLKIVFDGKVSYDNLVKMFNSVKIQKESSCTSIQIVYSCFDQKPYQMKIISNSINYNLHDFRLELEVLSLQHKNMIKLKDFFIEKEKYYIVYEYLEGRTLRERLNSQYKMQKTEIILILKQLLNLIISLHQNNFICRELITDNIIILQDGRVIVTEFGQATKVSDILKTKRGTKDIDAELLQQSQLEDNIDFEKQFWLSQDVYNLGSVFHEMITGKSLQKTIFDKHSVNYSSQNTMTSFRKKQGLKLLLDLMLEPDPKLRITAEQAKNFIKDMEFGDDSYEDLPDCDERSKYREVFYFQPIVNLQNL